MQDFLGNDLQVGDTVIYYTLGNLRQKGGMREGVIINFRGTFANDRYGIARIADMHSPDQELTELGYEHIYQISMQYRGTHPSHLRELFPYKETVKDDSYPSW